MLFQRRAVYTFIDDVTTVVSVSCDSQSTRNLLAERKLMTSRVQFENAVKRYSWTAVGLGIATFAIFDAVLFVHFLLLRPFTGPIREFAASWRPASEVVLPLAIFVAAGPIPLLFLWWGIRRARQNPTLHCTFCIASVAEFELRRQVLLTGMCPHCGNRMISE